jgi:hypothetical protein
MEQVVDNGRTSGKIADIETCVRAGQQSAFPASQKARKMALRTSKTLVF